MISNKVYISNDNLKVELSERYTTPDSPHSLPSDNASFLSSYRYPIFINMVFQAFIGKSGSGVHVIFEIDTYVLLL